MKNSPAWFVYMVKCRDETLYTGTTNDLEARITTHNSGRGAKYTRSRGPVQLVYSEKHEDRSSALKREAAIKKLKKAEKQKLTQSV